MTPHIHLLLKAAISAAMKSRRGGGQSLAPCPPWAAVVGTRSPSPGARSRDPLALPAHPRRLVGSELHPAGLAHAWARLSSSAEVVQMDAREILAEDD
jgi:hypothetical protein